MHYNEELTFLKNKISNLYESVRAGYKFKIRLEVFKKLNLHDPLYGELVSRRVFDSFEPFKSDNLKKMNLYNELLRYSLIVFIQEFQCSEVSRKYHEISYKITKKLIKTSDSYKSFKKSFKCIKEYLAKKQNISELEQFKINTYQQNDIDFSLQDFFHISGQIFYIVVIPNPFFLKKSKSELQENQNLMTEREMLEMISTNKKFYIQILDLFFPKLSDSFIFEYIYNKMQSHMWNLLEGWKKSTLHSNLSLVNPLLNIYSDPHVHNKQNNVLLEKLQLPSRLTNEKETIYFVNGFLSKELNHYDYFKDFFCFFPFINKYVVRWNADCLDFMNLSNEITSLINGVYYLIISITTGKLVGPQAIINSIKTISNLIFKYKNTEKKAVQSSKFAYNLILNRNKISQEGVNFVCFSLGSKLVFHLLEEALKDDNCLLINNVVFVSAVLCQDHIQKNIGRLIGRNGLIKGKIIIIKSNFDLVLYFFIYKIMQKKPLGLNSFNFCKAVKNLKNQCSYFAKLSNEETDKYIKSKIVEINMSDYKMGHLDMSKNFGIISSEIKKHWN